MVAAINAPITEVSPDTILGRRVTIIGTDGVPRSRKITHAESDVFEWNAGYSNISSLELVDGKLYLNQKA